MSLAVDVYGSDTDAKERLEMETPSLDGKKPIDLMATYEGAEMVRDYLQRLSWDVYT